MAAALTKTLRNVRPPPSAATIILNNHMPQNPSFPNPTNPPITTPNAFLQFIQLRFWRNNKSNYIPKSHSLDHINENEPHTPPPIREAGKTSISYYTGDNISKRDKEKFLLDMILELKDSKEAVYGSLDAWVAWEQNFPIAMLKRVLVVLERKYEWHRVIQVIKWMLSKGQGSTMNTYGQLIKALDMDHRPEEAHRFWMKRIGSDLHAVPWDLCKRMISIYYRNNMLENLVKPNDSNFCDFYVPQFGFKKLFKGLESFDRKPPDKSIVQKVANAYEVLGQLDEKNRILEKYDYLFSDNRTSFKKSRKDGHKKKAKEGLDECVSDMDEADKDYPSTADTRT